MPLMSKTQRVVEYVRTDDGLAQFGQEDMEADSETVLMMPVGDWEDMGSPDKLTITIVSGDLLSGQTPTPEQAAAAGLRMDSPPVFREPGSVGD